MLTSVVFFVATTVKPSFALFLFIVDVCALLLQIICTPYVSICDNWLSTIFLTVESFIFLVVLIVLADINSTENYQNSAMFTTLFIAVGTCIFVAVPLNLYFKYRSKVNPVQNNKTLTIPDPRQDHQD